VAKINYKIISQDVNTRSENPLKKGTAGHRTYSDRNENQQQFSYRNALCFTSSPHSSRFISILFSLLHKSDSLPRFTRRALYAFHFFHTFHTSQ